MLWNGVFQHMCRKTPAAQDTSKNRTKEQLLHHILGNMAINKTKQTSTKRDFSETLKWKWASLISKGVHVRQSISHPYLVMGDVSAE